jgi:hypothetical protein
LVRGGTHVPELVGVDEDEVATQQAGLAVTLRASKADKEGARALRHFFRGSAPD